MHEGVRYLQINAVKYEFAIQKNIDVEGARTVAPFLVAPPPGALFDVVKNPQEVVRRIICVQLHHLIEEVRLISPVHRGSSHNRGCPREESRLPKVVLAPLEGLFRGALRPPPVGPQAEINGGQNSSSSGLAS